VHASDDGRGDNQSGLCRPTSRRDAGRPFPCLKGLQGTGSRLPSWQAIAFASSPLPVRDRVRGFKAQGDIGRHRRNSATAAFSRLFHCRGRIERDPGFRPRGDAGSYPRNRRQHLRWRDVRPKWMPERVMTDPEDVPGAWPVRRRTRPRAARPRSSADQAPFHQDDSEIEAEFHKLRRRGFSRGLPAARLIARSSHGGVSRSQRTSFAPLRRACRRVAIKERGSGRASVDFTIWHGFVS